MIRRLTIAAAAGPLLLILALGAALAHEADAPAPPELSFGRSAEYDYDPPEPGSYRLPAIKPAGDGAVLDTQGRAQSLRALMDDRITVLAFIYTRCSDPQGCPLAVSVLYDLQFVARADPAFGERLRLIGLSFDVGYDTPEVLAEYAGRGPGGASEILFLTARSEADLKAILKAYDQPIGRKTDAADPFGPYTHQLLVFLIDRAGQVRNIYSLGFLDPRLVAADIRTLLLEERGGAPGG